MPTASGCYKAVASEEKDGQQEIEVQSMSNDNKNKRNHCGLVADVLGGIARRQSACYR